MTTMYLETIRGPPSRTCNSVRPDKAMLPKTRSISKWQYLSYIIMNIGSPIDSWMLMNTFLNITSHNRLHLNIDVPGQMLDVSADIPHILYREKLMHCITTNTGSMYLLQQYSQMPFCCVVVFYGPKNRKRRKRSSKQVVACGLPWNRRFSCSRVSWYTCNGCVCYNKPSIEITTLLLMGLSRWGGAWKCISLPLHLEIIKWISYVYQT